MRLIYLVMLAILASSVLSAPMAAAASNDEDKEDSEITSRQFSFRVGEGVKIGDYRVELISVVSIMDGLIEVKVWKRVSEFEDWRVMEDHRDANFDEGASHGGLTLTVIDIFDEDTVRMRAEYRTDYGYPQKYVTERALAPRSLPKLDVETTVDRAEVSVGDEVKVTITLKNTGNDTARDVTVQDSPPLPQFRYLAGYPPKIKNQLQPGESDIAIYSMVAATEGEVKIPATVARYADSKSTIYTGSSPSIKIEIRPKRKPDLVVKVDPPAAIEHGSEGAINVTVENQGDASAYRVEVESDLRSGGEGLKIVKGSLDESFFEIPPGGAESYSATVRGSESGAHTVGLVARYQGDGEMMQADTTFEIAVLEREHKYIYYLPVVPVVIMGVWLFRRYKEYKY
ncbi:COG1361 S-layer family protein [Methanocrinis sp.]|uniref:COG1361 S-layer family protein n=1 Tax=Methanocrinis sp. TaxID=3101522 RepID=UPI003D0E750F